MEYKTPTQIKYPYKENRKIRRLHLQKNKIDPRLLNNPWSKEEEDKLLIEIQTLKKEEIAKIHNRTVNGISSRLRKLALRMYNENISLDIISNKTKISKEEFINYIEHKKIKEQKYQEKMKLKEEKKKKKECIDKKEEEKK